ncbi:MAG: O-antigen ligase family protein [Candidatus Gracilibacteria bacterium]
MNTETSEQLSWNYYIPLYLIFISLLLFTTRDFNQTQQSAIGLSNIHKIISVPLAIVMVLYYFLQKLKFRKLPIPLFFYILFIFTAVIGSLLTSNWLVYSLYKLLEVVAVLMTINYFWDLSYNNKKILKNIYELTIKFYKLLIIVSLLGAIIYPKIAIRPPSLYQEAYLPFQLFGSIIAINANSLGMIGAVVFYISFISFSKEKTGVGLLWLILSLIIVIFAQSRTSVIGLILVISLFLFIHSNTNIIKKILIIMMSIFVFSMSINTLVSYLERGYSVKHMEKLSGRSQWWEYAWNYFNHSDIYYQLFGGGFGEASREILAKMGHPDASTLHSDYMDSLVGSGYIGFSFFVLMNLSVIFMLLKNFAIIKKDFFLLELTGVIVLLLIRSFTGPTLVTNNFFLILYFILITNFVFYIKRKKAEINDI